MSLPTLRIVDWTKIYENNRTRELKRLDWVPIPNSMDGDGYTELLDHPNGAAHFGCWIAIVEIASRCDVRGTLSRQGATIPHDAASLARMSRIPALLFAEAIPRLLRLRWLEQVNDDSPQSTENYEDCTFPQEGAVIPQEGAVLTRARSGTERNGREGNGTEESGGSTLGFEEAPPLIEEPVKPKRTTPSAPPAGWTPVGGLLPGDIPRAERKAKPEPQKPSDVSWQVREMLIDWLYPCRLSKPPDDALCGKLLQIAGGPGQIATWLKTIGPTKDKKAIQSWGWFLTVAKAELQPAMEGSHAAD